MAAEDNGFLFPYLCCYYSTNIALRNGGQQLDPISPENLYHEIDSLLMGIYQSLWVS
jgi:hypothetical protein